MYDGYFPSELQERYPEGLAFEIFNKCMEDYVGSAPPSAPTVASAPAPAPAPSGRAVAGLASVGAPDLPMSTAEFVAGLPSCVVAANGDMVSVRDGIAKLLEAGGGGGGGGGGSGGGDGGGLVVAVAGLDAAPPSAPRATIQVKSSDGAQTMTVRALATTTVAELRAAIDSTRTTPAPYELRTAYPRRALTDLTETMAAAKLAPAAMLYMRTLT